MKAQQFDKKFDEGKDEIIDDLDLSTLKRPNLTQRRVNVDFPEWMIASLDKEARRPGVTRQSIIKIWLAARAYKPVAGRFAGHCRAVGARYSNG